MTRTISLSEVSKHNNAKDCWIIIHGKVYDVTNFLPEHPGGSKVILTHAGKDATKAFDPIHPIDIIGQYLSPEVCIGSIDHTEVANIVTEETEEEKRVREAHENKPHLEEMLNVFDFEAVARQVLKPDAWAYYSSGSDDEITLRENHAAFHRLWLIPRILINVRDVDYSTTILGHKTSFPLYITATALGKLGHPEGEVILTRAAAKQKIIQMIPTLASCSFDEMINSRAPSQVQFFQLYVNVDRAVTEKLVRNAEAKGVKALFITVDAPQLGRREKDMRMKYQRPPPDVQLNSRDSIDKSQGAARAISKFIDPGLCWADLEWFKSITKLPLILKGVGCAEDAVLAAKAGCHGVVLSNHGGRQLDFARSGIEILPEVIGALHKANVDTNKFEVFVDGGVRRGTDIIKAIALGAKAVGIGRPALYAMSSYGQPGVERMIQLLKDEVEMNMRLIGAPTIKDLKPEMVDIRNLKDHFVVTAEDGLTASVYEPMRPRAKL